MEYITDEHVDRLANTLSLLGESSRLNIVIYLLDKEVNVSKIVMDLKISQPTVSHHLRILKDARILKAEKKGKNVYYSINDYHVKNIVESGLMHMLHGE